MRRAGEAAEALRRVQDSVAGLLSPVTLWLDCCGSSDDVEIVLERAGREVGRVQAGEVLDEALGPWRLEMLVDRVR